MSARSRFAVKDRTGQPSSASGATPPGSERRAAAPTRAQQNLHTAAASTPPPASPKKPLAGQRPAPAVTSSTTSPTVAKQQPVDVEKNLKALLQMDTFQGRFDADAFVERLMQPVTDLARENPKDFDPKPFIRVFETSIDRLHALQTQLGTHIQQLQHDAHRADTVFRKRATMMDDEFTELQRVFEDLETGITEVGSTAITVGEQLETVDRQRSRGSEARALLGYYLDFASSGKAASEKLEDLRNNGVDGQFQVAVICRRLLSIANDVNLEATKSARERIERYCEHFEKSVLEEFGEAYKAGDLAYVGMCARVLLEFNGGGNCVQVYLSQHGFFAANADLVPDLDKDDTATPRRGNAQKDIPEWARDPAPVDNKLKRLLQEVVDVVYAEWDVIARVFPNSIAVMQLFVQRIFAFTLQNYVEQLVARAQGYSQLRQLRVLTATKRAVGKCVHALKKFDEDVIQKADIYTGDSGPVNVSGSVSSILDRCLDDLFSAHTDKEKYIDAEQKVITGAYGEILALFKEYQAQRRAVLKSQSVLFRTLNQITDATGQSSGDGPPKITVAEIEGKLQAEVALKMLMVHAEAVGRCHELSAGSELTRNMRTLFRLLLESINHAYVDVALETALENLQLADGKTAEPVLDELEVIVTADQVARLLQCHFETSVLPFLANSPAVLREVMAEKNAQLGQIEAKSNALMHKILDVVMNWLTQILAKQKKTDYKPKDNEIDIMSLSTTPCNQACEFIRKVHAAAVKQMGSGRNLEIFLTEVGVSFHGMLLDHFKKFTVNATGGLVISKDIALYQEAADKFSQRLISDRFEMLRELANIYLVKPSILRSLLSEGHLGKLEYKTVLPFLQMREDWSSAKVERELRSDVVITAGDL